MEIAIEFLLTFLLTVLVVWLTRYYALANSLVDIPNDRSSHTVTTPRGGGIGIVLSFFLFVFWFTRSFPSISEFAPGLMLGAALVALVGWMDDHNHVPAQWRIAIHLLAATWFLYWLDGLSILHFGDSELNVGWMGAIAAAIGLVWMTNLTNFMDGIDGLAGVEGVTVMAAGGLLFLLSGYQGLAVVSFILAVSSLGFLIWNWPPARIFMGDVGSGMLGFTIGCLMLIGERQDAISVFVWLILLAVFVGDATYTLIQRIIKHEPWTQAHNSHAYQKLIQMGYSHSRVTISVLLVNIILLWPLAWLAWRYEILMPWILFFVYLAGWLLWKKINNSHTMAASSQ